MHLPAKNKDKKWKALFLSISFIVCMFCFSANTTHAAVDAAAEKRCTDSGGTGISMGGLGRCQCPSPKVTSGDGATCQTKAEYEASMLTGTPNDPALSGKDTGTAPGGGLMDNIFGRVFKYLIYAVFVVFGWLLTLSGIIMGWVCDVNNVQFFMNNDAVLTIWRMVRDFANMFFILVLLFSAFCTIFQVTKWGIKNIWLNVLINALLVNFSYSIARFLIDIANVIMYYLLNNAFGATTMNGGGGILANIATNTSISNILVPEKVTDYEVSYLIVATIFVFILAMTLLVVAGMFVVRLIRLTVLVMFSPVGFVGYIFPSFNKYANTWWDDLFKYAFMGPIMLFAIMVATKMMEAMSKQSAMAGFTKEAQQSAPVGFDAGFLASLAFYMIPIFILWIGVSTAASISGEVSRWAGKVFGKGKKFGNYLKGLPGKGWRATGIPGGVKKGWDDARKTGRLFGSDKLGFALKSRMPGLTEKMGSRIGGTLEGGWGAGKEKANKAAEKKKLDEFRKKYKEKAEDHDRMDAVGNGGLIDEILKADLHAGDASTRKDNAMKVASMLHALKTDSEKKEDFELKLREGILATHATGLAGMSDDAKDVFIKRKIQENWKILNKKGKQAHDVAATGTATGPKIDHAHATSEGAVNTWT